MSQTIEIIGREIPEPFKSAGRMPHFVMTVEYACGCSSTGGDHVDAACLRHGKPAVDFYEGAHRPKPTLYVQHSDGSFSPAVA